MDNVKSLRLSWAELESLITESVISGRQLYVGEAQRPNLLTWFMTLNGVSLSSDLAQRAVIIKLVKGDNDGRWLETTIKYIDKYRQEIIGDIIGILQQVYQPVEGFSFSRWATWEQHVLCKLDKPIEAQRLLLERQKESDAEVDEIDVVEDFFANKLVRNDYNPNTCMVRLLSRTVAEWYCEAMHTKMRTDQACRRLHQLAKEGRLRQLSVDKSRTYGRCFVWAGQDADKIEGRICNDLVEKQKATGWA